MRHGLSLSSPAFIARASAGGGAASPPVNTVPPSITGTAQVDEEQTCDPGSYSPAAESFAYQWEADNAPISGATSATFTPGNAEAGTPLTCVVTPSNAAGEGDPVETAPTAALTARQKVSITTVADTAGALDGKYMEISDDTERYGLYIHSYAHEETLLDFTGKSSADFIVGGPALYLNINIYGTDSTLWFNTGSETAPSGQPALVEIYTEDDDDAALAVKVAAALGTGATVEGGTVVRYHCPVAQTVTPASAGTSGVGITIVNTGVSGATQPSMGGTTQAVQVDYERGSSAAEVAAGLASILTGLGFTQVSLASNVLIVRDAATGARTAATAGDTGFTVTTLTTGA